MAKDTYLEVLKWASSFLTDKGKETYAAEYLMLERLGLTKTQWVRRLNQVMPVNEVAQFKADLKLFVNDVPAQYIIGSCEFYSARFKVTKDTLIPRPETEELVHLCLNTNELSQPLKVLDIGTGTGAIALTLKRLAPNWQVSAVDISAAALEVAKENAKDQGLTVNFYLGDLVEPVAAEQFDIIISNPPYISHGEWEEMDESVRTHEPKLALFAEQDGLDIYQRLSRELSGVIKPQGKIYLEIGYRQGQAVKELFKKSFPTKQINLHHDLNGHERMVEVCG